MKKWFLYLMCGVTLLVQACDVIGVESGPVTLNLRNMTLGDLTEFEAFDRYLGVIPEGASIVVYVDETIKNGQHLMEEGRGTWNGVRVDGRFGWCGTGSEIVQSGEYNVDIRLGNTGSSTGVLFYLR